MPLQYFSTFSDLNEFGRRREPVFFLIDYKVQKIILIPVSQMGGDVIFASKRSQFSGVPLPGFGNPEQSSENPQHSYGFSEQNSPPHLEIIRKIDKKAFTKAFNAVQKYLLAGDSYLLNLAFETEIAIQSSLLELFHRVSAGYKVFYKNQFLCFSPESFIHINADTIHTRPMKGTIRADNPSAREILINDAKELAEHHTVVDLLRSDLGLVAKKIKVEQFRYVEQIVTGHSDLLTTSTLISGQLHSDWHNHIGDILAKLLPAGSVTGAPKKRTVEIINEIENFERGFYTGIAGVYDGTSLDSCVLIRFIENRAGKTFFKSGAGITVYSDVEKEYSELLNKIYLPM